MSLDQRSRLAVVALDAGVLLDDLEEWPVADAAAEGERATLEPADALLSGAESQLFDEARLADAGLAGDEEQAALIGAQTVDGLQSRSQARRHGRPSASLWSRQGARTLGPSRERATPARVWTCPSGRAGRAAHR